MRQRLGLSTPQDDDALTLWLEDPAHAEAFLEMEATLNAADDLADLPEVREMRRWTLAKSAPRRRPVGEIITFGFLLALAAVAAGVFWSRAGHPPLR